ncbi:MAG: hypothetical protein Q9227_009042 [Pyrenula ochraceoflavens]
MILKTIQTFRASGVDAKFAVRGEGHTPWAGSASIKDGVLVDMRIIQKYLSMTINSVSYIGSGAVWGDVDQKLDSLGLAVVGGRGSLIGVEGLITGGGISYFSARKGFACDNLVSYDVVLADGTITSASPEQNADLFNTLKGGSNSFCIVGNILYQGSASPTLIEAFASLNSSSEFHEHAHIILSFSSVCGMGEFASINVQYTEPTAQPAPFKPFLAAQPQISNTIRISNQPDFSTEFFVHQGPGRRQIYATHTFKNDLALLSDVYGLYKAAFQRFPKSEGTVCSLLLQPIQPMMIARSKDHGDNMLGLSPEDGPLVLCLLAISWDDPFEDGEMEQLAKDLNEGVVKLAKERGLWNRWVYSNYAAKLQDPMAGYGEQNRKFMRGVSRKYDPSGMFQKNVPGGFNLS